jgi:hypothetical protein
MKTKVNLVMAEFGSERRNSNQKTFESLSVGRNKFNPSLDSFLSYFDNDEGIELSVTIYTDQDYNNDDPAIKFVKKEPFYDQSHPRYGWRCNDYYKVLALLESEADIAISLDSDMLIVSPEVKTLIPLTKKFGVTLPVNPRMLVKYDGNIGQDGSPTKTYDDSNGNGLSTNMSPISFDTTSDRGRILLEEYCNQMTKDPVRGPLAMWRAQWESEINPYVLPVQWCICNQDCGIGNEIILHLGNQPVIDHYIKKES